jgi:transposase-like protein
VIDEPSTGEIRDGQVANRQICVALAVGVHGTRDGLGLRAGDSDEESAK